MIGKICKLTSKHSWLILASSWQTRWMPKSRSPNQGEPQGAKCVMLASVRCLWCQLLLSQKAHKHLQIKMQLRNSSKTEHFPCPGRPGPRRGATAATNRRTITRTQKRIVSKLTPSQVEQPFVMRVATCFHSIWFVFCVCFRNAVLWPQESTMGPQMCPYTNPRWCSWGTPRVRTLGIDQGCSASNSKVTNSMVW